MKNYKPWFMAFLVFTYLFFFMPAINSTANLFVVPTTIELGMTRAEYSLTFTITSILVVAINLVFGKIYKIFGLKKLLLFTTVCAVLSCLVSATANSSFMVYLGAVLRGFVMALGSTSIAATIINNWFDKRKGVILGIVFAGSGLGTMALMQTYTAWVNTLGWRVTYNYLAVIVGIPLLVATLFLKSTPTEAGTVPYGYDDKAEKLEKKEVQRDNKNVDYSFNQVKKMPIFYICMIIILLVNASLYGTYMHLVAFFSDINVDVGLIGSTLALIGMGTSAGKILYGWLSDRFGIHITLLVTAIFNVLSTYLLLSYSAKWMITIGGVLLGLAIGCLQVTVGVLAGLFGKKDYPIIVGLFTATLGAGWAVGPIIAGYVFDTQHTYIPVFVIFTIMVCIAAVLSFLVHYRMMYLKNKEIEELDNAIKVTD